MPHYSFGTIKQDVIQKAASIAIGAGLASVIAASPALALDKGSFNYGLGEGVFSGNCATCHSGGQNIIKAEATLELDALEDNLDGFADAGGDEKGRLAAIKYQVINGKNAMPAWGQQLKPEEIEAVANYVLFNATTDGW